jgi:phosphoserine phosphatase
MMLSSNLAAFDMDGTLIQGRLVFALADRFDLSDKVRSIQSHRLMAGHEQTKAIAALFAGLTTKDLESAIASIPFTKNCERTIAALKDRGYKIGIISDSYTIAAGFVAERLTCHLGGIGSAVIVKFLSASDITWKKVRTISVCQ